MSDSVLSPAARDAVAARLDGLEVDVLVIGGGVTGTGVALDAASRGLSVLLVESRDLAAGTSSKSSKLIHGGLRYLEQFNFGLVREALEERGQLVDALCPHLVQPLSFLYPLRHRGWERAYVGAGIALYDGLAMVGGDELPRHRHYSKRAALRRFPSLAPTALVGAVEYWDAQVDDARHTMMLMRTAASHGAELLTNAEVVAFRGLETGRVTGAVVHDRETGVRGNVTAGVVVNATGVWSERTEQLAGQPGLKMRASKGVHVVVPGDAIEGEGAIITRTESSVLFIIPFGQNWLLGTTDTDWNQPIDQPIANRNDVQYVLGQANSILDTPIAPEDVVSVFSGLRPLIAGNEAKTSELSREHATVRPIPGLVSTAGGKYTTYRVMAADAVDAAVDELGRAVPQSMTHELPLHGAAGYHQLVDEAANLAVELDLPESDVHRLLGRYGSGIREIASLFAEDENHRQLLDGGGPYLEAEVVLAVRAEGARHVEDVLTRRTRLSLESPDRGISAASRVAELMGEELGWASARRQLEVDSYRRRIEAEQAAEQEPSDHRAIEARLAAIDVRRLAFD